MFGDDILDNITLMISAFMVILMMVLLLMLFVTTKVIRATIFTDKKRGRIRVKELKTISIQSKVFVVSDKYDRQVAIPPTETGGTVPFQIIERMKWESRRLTSFQKCPLHPYPGFHMRLAKAGWFYSDTSNRITCYCCCITKGSWTADDDPDDVHRRLSPRCEFVSGRNSSNISLVDEYAVPTDNDVPRCSMCRRGTGTELIDVQCPVLCQTCTRIFDEEGQL